MKLFNSLNAWGSPGFENTLKQEIQDIDPDLLPLQQALSLSSYVSRTPVNATILNISDNNEVIIAKAGIFYTGIIAGCSCADDPTPPDEQTEYCEIQFIINKDTSETTTVLLEE